MRTARRASDYDTARTKGPDRRLAESTAPEYFPPGIANILPAQQIIVSD